MNVSDKTIEQFYIFVAMQMLILVDIESRLQRSVAIYAQLLHSPINIRNFLPFPRIAK